MAFDQYSDTWRTFTAKPWADLLAGYFVKAMSVAQVSPGADIGNSIEVDKVDAATDGNLCVGISIGSFVSGALATIAAEGIFNCTASGAITVGDYLAPSEADALGVISATAAYRVAGSGLIGKALSSAASTQNVVVALRI